MGFLKKLFGGGEKKAGEYVDTRGVYFYVRCHHCGMISRLRADKEYDLIREGDGFVWHKTVVDNRCFKPMPTVVTLDKAYQITHAEITGGEYVSQEEYQAWLEAQKAPADVGDATEEEEE
jgi:hypothetical protein